MAARSGTLWVGTMAGLAAFDGVLVPRLHDRRRALGQRDLAHRRGPRREDLGQHPLGRELQRRRALQAPRREVAARQAAADGGRLRRRRGKPLVHRATAGPGRAVPLRRGGIPQVSPRRQLRRLAVGHAGRRRGPVAGHGERPGALRRRELRDLDDPRRADRQKHPLHDPGRGRPSLAGLVRRGDRPLRRRGLSEPPPSRRPAGGLGERHPRGRRRPRSGSRRWTASPATARGACPRRSASPRSSPTGPTGRERRYPCPRRRS